MDAWGRIAIVCGLFAAPAVACVLDIPDVTSGDASTDAKASDVATNPDVPASCATLDASCVPTIPEGWQPVVVSTACGADFTSAAYVGDPKLVANACACSACSTTGAHSCDAGTITYTTSTASCTTTETLPVSQCVQGTVSGYLQYDNYGALGNVTCTPGTLSNANATSTPVTACYPTNCSSDFCGASGLKCIEQVGDTTCPSGFSQKTLVGDSVSALCGQCNCAVKSAICSGTLQCWSSDPSCAGGAQVTVSAGNICTSVGSACGLAYLKFTPGLPPSASCTTTQDASAAVLTGERTICCVP